MPSLPAAWRKCGRLWRRRELTAALLRVGEQLLAEHWPVDLTPLVRLRLRHVLPPENARDVDALIRTIGAQNVQRAGRGQRPA
jgi:hypothetical protein